MKQKIVDVDHITKKFGAVAAVEDISFTIKEGEVVGLLGPNGAGKTTTIQMLLGVLTPTGGNILYFGKNLLNHREEILEKINFSSTYTQLPWRLTVRENLTWVSYLYQVPNRKKRVDEIIETFKITDLVNKSISQLSAGQKTRVNLAKAFINFPKVLLLDEPTASLDPEIAVYLRHIILSNQKKYAMSIIWTSHNMAEVEEVCDRVIFINNGKVVASDTPMGLAKTIQNAHVSLLVPDYTQKVILLAKDKNATYRQEKNTIIIDLKEKDIPSFLNELAIRKIAYSEISIEKPTLEDYFLEVAKK